MTTTLTPSTGPETLTPPGLRLSADSVRAVSERRGDPAWVRELRARGWEAWEDIPFPTLATEGWRRSDLRWVDLESVFTPAAGTPRATAAARLEDLPPALLDQLQRDFDGAALLIEQDGQPVYRSVQDEPAAQGVIFTDLHSALREHPDLVRRYFMRLVPPRWLPGEPSNAGKFEALNAALFDGGTFLYVPPDT
ncbi:MAG TPA: hypothetical protein VNK05_11440, partial [Chloroflexota bacterium]|nr:hypothetical protein [Chloroflexota bacterium]